MVILVRANLSGLTWELVFRAIMVVRTHLIFLFGRPLWGHRCIQVSGALGRPLCHPFQITSQTRVGFSTAFEGVTRYETDCGSKSRANERPW